MPWQYLNGNLQAPYQDRELAIIKTCSTFRPPRVPDYITKYDPLEPKRFITCQWSWPPFQMFHVNALVVRSWKTANTLAILGGRGLFPPPHPLVFYFLLYSWLWSQRGTNQSQCEQSRWQRISLSWITFEFSYQPCITKIAISLKQTFVLGGQILPKPTKCIYCNCSNEHWVSRNSNSSVQIQNICNPRKLFRIYHA